MRTTRRPVFALLIVFVLSAVLCSGSATLIIGPAFGRFVLSVVAATGLLLLATTTLSWIVFRGRKQENGREIEEVEDAETPK